MLRITEFGYWQLLKSNPRSVIIISIFSEQANSKWDNKQETMCHISFYKLLRWRRKRKLISVPWTMYLWCSKSKYILVTIRNFNSIPKFSQNKHYLLYRFQISQVVITSRCLHTSPNLKLFHTCVSTKNLIHNAKEKNTFRTSQTDNWV